MPVLGDVRIELCIVPGPEPETKLGMGMRIGLQVGLRVRRLVGIGNGFGRQAIVVVAGLIQAGTKREREPQAGNKTGRDSVADALVAARV